MYVDVLSILNRYGLLHEDIVQSGNNIKLNCPFHNELNASLSINLDSGNYFCFGCESSGSIFKFIMELEEVNSLQAARIINKYKNKRRIKTNKEDSRKKKLKSAYRHYKRLIVPNWEELKMNYMINERGFYPNVLKKFKVKLNSEKDYPILIPIFENGKYKGNLRRRTDDKEESKYLNSKGFCKKKTLGGNYEKGSTILVVEGYLDMMKAYQFGYKNVVCLFGCIPSDEQIKKLKHATNNIITALDNTPLGKKGNKMLSKHFKVRKFKYPFHIKDICDFKSKYSFNKAINTN